MHATGPPSTGLKFGHNRKRTDEPVDIVFLDAEAISQDHTVEHNFHRGAGHLTAIVNPRSAAGQQAHRDSEVLERATKPVETDDTTVVIGKLNTASLSSLHQGEITRTTDATSRLDDADVNQTHSMLEQCSDLLQQRCPPTADVDHLPNQLRRGEDVLEPDRVLEVRGGNVAHHVAVSLKPQLGGNRHRNDWSANEKHRHCMDQIARRVRGGGGLIHARETVQNDVEVAVH